MLNQSHVEDVVFDVIQDVSPAVVLPITSVLLQSIRHFWDHPDIDQISQSHVLCTRIDSKISLYPSKTKFSHCVVFNKG